MTEVLTGCLCLSQSSTSSASEDEDADAEYSPKEDDSSDDEEVCGLKICDIDEVILTADLRRSSRVRLLLVLELRRSAGTSRVTHRMA